MTKKFFSIENLLKELTKELLVGSLGSGILWVISKQWWVLLLAMAFVVIFISYRFFIKYKRFFKLIKAGVSGYYYSFDIAENKKIFGEVKNSFCYVGISSNTILEMFREWANANTSVEAFQFLLMDPESPALIKQIAFEKGVALDTDLSSLSDPLRQTIIKATEIEKERINSAIDILKTLSAYKNGKLRIRLYQTFMPYWMYIIDDKKAYVGILERGKRGQESPVMILTKLVDFPSPFDVYKNTWDWMWELNKDREV